MNAFFKLLISLIPLFGKLFFNIEVIVHDERYKGSIIRKMHVHQQGNKSIWLEKDFKTLDKEPLVPEELLQQRKPSFPFDFFGGYSVHCRFKEETPFFFKPSEDFKELTIFSASDMKEARLNLKDGVDTYKVKNDEFAEKMKRTLMFMGLMFCFTIIVCVGMSLYFGVTSKMDYVQYTSTLPGKIHDGVVNGIIDGFREAEEIIEEIIPGDLLT